MRGLNAYCIFISKMNNKTDNSTKNAIIRAASTAFRMYGYKKTTLDDITSILKIGKTGIYYYFKNKQEIFEAVIESEADKLKNILTKNNESIVDPKTKFKNHFRLRMNYFRKMSKNYSSIRQELFEQISTINKTRAELDQIERICITQILEEGKEKQIFHITNTTEIAKTITITLKSLEIPFFVLNKNSGDYEPILENLISIILYGLTADSKK